MDEKIRDTQHDADDTEQSLLHCGSGLRGIYRSGFGKLNFEFLNAAAMTGAAVFASVTPGILQMAGEQRLHDIFQTACSVRPDEGAVITDWLYTAVPSGFSFRGKEYRYNWYEEYRGARHDLTWLA